MYLWSPWLFGGGGGQKKLEKLASPEKSPLIFLMTIAQVFSRQVRKGNNTNLSLFMMQQGWP